MTMKSATALLLGILLLASCGGGGGGSGGAGGGGGGGGNDGVRFTPNTTSIDLAYDEDSLGMPVARVTVTATGSFNGTLYIGAEATGSGIDPTIQTEVSGTQATFSISAKPGLAAGSYSGTVRLLGCSDVNCSRQIGNSPIIVNYELTVRATLKTMPAQVTANSSSGESATQAVNVRLPDGAASYSAVVSSEDPWIVIDQETATGFRVSLLSLPQGSYTGTIRVTADNSAFNIPVSYQVSGGPPRTEMVVSAPNGFTLSGFEGAISAPIRLDVTPPSWDPVTQVRFTTSFSSSSPAPDWLSAASVAGGHDIIVDATDLSAGTYSAVAWVTGGWPTTEVQVPIALTIGTGLQRPADVIAIVDSETTAAALNGSVPVNVTAGPGTNWTATKNVQWLQLSGVSGATGETLDYQIDPAQLGALPNGAEHIAQVTITPEKSTMTAVSFDIRVNKRVAAVTHVAPYVMPTQQPTSRIILRGFGFDGVDNLAQRLQFAGGTVSAVTLVNDTEVLVTTGPLSQGSFPMSFSNAMNYSAAAAALVTFAPTSQPAASLATGGNLRGLFYDAERQSAYAVNVDLESLQRFRLGAQWEVDSIPVPAILSAGLTRDGSRLLVASSADGVSRIRQLDSTDFTNEHSVADIQQQLYRGFTYLGGVIPTTNDGRSWFAVGSTWNELAFFDAGTQAMTVVQPPFQTSFHGGPWFGLARDGERLLVPQSGSITPAPPALYMDAADSELRINPAGLTNTYRMSLNDDGDRVVFDNYEVRDRAFTLIGRLPALPRLNGEPSYFITASQISPDGTRLYALAYPDALPYEGYPARIYVVDTSTRQTSSNDLPLLGFADLTGYPSCNDWQQNSNCHTGTHTAISPDGANLYLAGNTNFMVVPVSDLTLTPVSRMPPAHLKQGRSAMTPWRLTLGKH